LILTQPANDQDLAASEASGKGGGVVATIIVKPGAGRKYVVRYRHEGRQLEKGFATRREAKDWLVKFEHDSREQTFVDPKMAGERFGRVADRWLARHPGSPRTKQWYETVLRRHVKPVFGTKTLAAVATDREGVERFLRETLPAKGLGASVANSCYTVIKAIVNDAIKAGRLPASAHRLRGIEIPRVAQKASLVFASHDQVKRLAEGMPEPYGLTIYLMRGCGLRLGEALGVQRDDFNGGSLRLSRQLAPDGREARPLKHRDEGQFRDIPVPAYVSAALVPEWAGFPGVDHRAYRAWFNRARDNAGLPKTFTPHVLRHIFASVALAGGIPITDVSKWLGHRDINVTFGIYGHLVPASWERARGVLDAEWNE
jgi:integrase